MMEYSITIDGASIPYYDQGDGAPLLLMHGILSDHRIYQTHCDLLSDQYRTIAYRMGGFGMDGVNTPADQFNTERHKKELIHFCEALSLSNITLVAWSYSVHVALLAAKERPDLIGTILLYEPMVPSYGINDEEMALYSRDLTKMMAPVIRSLRKEQWVEAADQFIHACTVGENEHGLEEQRAMLQIIKRDNLHTLPLLLSQATPKSISGEEIEALPQNILIIRGELTRPIFTIASDVLARHRKERNLVVINGADHYLPEEKPKLFTERVREWLNQLTIKK